MSRSAYCNTSYDLQKWLPALHRMVLSADMEGEDGIFPSGCSTFISSSALYSSYGMALNDTLIIAEGEDNAGVYHVNSVVSDNVLILNRTSVTSVASLTWQATKMLNRIAQDASDVVDEELADLSNVISVPFDREMLQTSLASVDDLDESIPLSLAGYKLDFEVSASNYPVGITLNGYGEYLDWRNAGVTTKFTTDDTARPVTDDKSQTESMSFTSAGTLTTTRKWREITGITATYTGTGTLTARLTVPRTVKRLAAMEAVIQLTRGSYMQGTSNRSEWIEEMEEKRDKIYKDYRLTVRSLAELTENTIQRGVSRIVRITRG